MHAIGSSVHRADDGEVSAVLNESESDSRIASGSIAAAAGFGQSPVSCARPEGLGGRAAARGMVRYPRASLAASLSILILGATVATRPSLAARHPPGHAKASSPYWDEKPGAER